MLWGVTLHLYALFLYALFRSSAIEMFVVHLRVCAGGMDDAIPVVRRRLPDILHCGSVLL